MQYMTQERKGGGQKRRRNVPLGERKNESNELIYNQSVSLFGEIHALLSINKHFRVP